MQSEIMLFDEPTSALDAEMIISSECRSRRRGSFSCCHRSRSIVSVRVRSSF